MAEVYEWDITEEQSGTRLDAVLAQELNISRSQAQQWLEKDLVTMGGGETPWKEGEA